MNYIKLFFVVLVLNCGACFGQNVQDVFTKTEMTWYGLDFTKAKFVGDFSNFNTAGQQSATQLKGTYFRGWNAVVANEHEKYNLPVFYSKEKVNMEMSGVDALNATVNEDSMMMPWGTAKELTKGDIQNAVNKYKNNGKSGLGLTFIIESFDKAKELATIHVTFFDISTNKVLLIKKLQVAPRGIGLRNYWVSTVFFAMDECKANWKKWKKEAGVAK
jgi:hypothetical protein